MKSRILFIALLATAFFSSCKPHQALVQPSSPPHEVDSTASLAINTLMIPRFNAIWTADGATKSFKGSLRIERNKSIYITINPAMGIEIFRIKITPDSILMLDRYNKQYFVGDLKTMEEAWGIKSDFHTLQSLLLHETYPKQDPAQSTFFANSQDQLVKTVINDPVNNHYLELNYSNFQTTELGSYPLEYLMDLRFQEKPASLQLDLNTIHFNVPIKTPFHIPASYKPMKNLME